MQELSEVEAQIVARFEAAPAAPESFDPIAALRRVEALAEGLDQFGTDRDRDNESDDAAQAASAAAYLRSAHLIRAALAPQADDGPRDIWLRS